MTIKRNEKLNLIMRNLCCASVTEIANESGFNSRQALHQYLKRHGFKIRYEFSLEPIGE
jgi:AraC-like DNA-binding protein